MRYDKGNFRIVNVATKLPLFREPSRSRDRRRGRQYGAVAGDDPPVERHKLVWRMRCDRLRDAAGRDRKESGRAADRDAVIGDAERPGPVEDGLDLVVATEIALPPDDRGALEEVAGAVGRPGIDPDIDEPPIGEAAMGQECVEVHDLFLAEVSVGKPNS